MTDRKKSIPRKETKTDLEKLTATFDSVGIDYAIRESESGDSFLFMGECFYFRHTDGTFDTYEDSCLEALCGRNDYFEFDEAGKLVGY